MPPTVQQLPASSKVFYERVPVRVYVVLGKTVAQPPQPQALVNAMFAKKTATRVYYMECWQKDSLVAGTGYDDFWYIGVYS